MYHYETETCACLLPQIKVPFNKVSVKVSRVQRRKPSVSIELAILRSQTLRSNQLRFTEGL